jgi:hypothetical protein
MGDIYMDNLCIYDNDDNDDTQLRVIVWLHSQTKRFRYCDEGKNFQNAFSECERKPRLCLLLLLLLLLLLSSSSSSFAVCATNQSPLCIL